MGYVIGYVVAGRDSTVEKPNARETLKLLQGLKGMDVRVKYIKSPHGAEIGMGGTGACRRARIACSTDCA